MVVRNIVTNPIFLLRQVSEPVEPSDPAVVDLVADMLDTMSDTGGAGLAAVQIGVSKRVVVIDAVRVSPLGPQVLLNPMIIGSSAERSSFREGCLSIPGVMVDVTRPSKIRVRFDRLDGAEEILDADGILATCLQHEIDHLDGILIIDRGEPLLIDRPTHPSKT